MTANWAEQILAILIKRSGGEITITRDEFIDANESTLYMDHDVITGNYKFKVEDNAVIQGVVV